MQLGGQPLNQGVGPDLIEVLATRKLLEEKATIARDLALKQQPTPNTIAEQQDQKLLGLTQKEIATQTGGILANRAQQQGKPQPRPQQGGIMGAMGGAPRPPMGGMGGAPRPPMGGAPRPPMGGAPRPPMGGIAGAAPRPPMMASGGIVGYNVGGKVKSAEEAVRALGLVDDPTSPAHQAKLQKIMQTLTAQSNPEEKAAVQKVLVDAGLKTGPTDKIRSGAYADDGYVFPEDRKGEDTSAAGVSDADREKLKQHKNYNMGSPFGGGAGSPAHGDLITKQIDERGGMAIVDQAMMLGGLGAVKQIIANVGKKYGPKVINYAKQKLAKGKDFVRTPATKPKYKMGADGKPVMTAPGQAASPNTGNLTGAMLGLGGLAYGADAVMGGTKPPTADMGGAGVLRPETDQKSVDQKLIDDTNRDAIAQYGSKDGPTVDDAKAFVRDQYNKEADGPQAGTGKEFDLSVDPSEFSSTSVSDSMNPQMKKQLDRQLALDPKTAADEERTVAMERYKVDETTSGLQDILDRQLAESRRVADDPQAKYKRDKASIYAARAGAPGRAYQQRVLDEQGKEGKLLAQELNNFATAANTEAALITKVDAEAGKAATLAATMLNNSMQVASTFTVANQQAFREMIANRGTQLKSEAELKLKREYNIALNEIQTMQQIVAASNAMSSIIAAELTQLQNSQKYMAAGTEGRKELEKTLVMEQNIKYIYPQQELIKRISTGFDIDLGDSGGSGGSEVGMTDEEAAAMAQ
jgi:hypothetical protein